MNNKNKLKNLALLSLFLLSCCFVSCGSQGVRMSREKLLDKIKGGWAGQTIGVIYGAPTEFKYNGIRIPDSVPIGWKKGACKWYFDHNGGIYDDLYMDLTFVEAFDRYGFDVTADTLAQTFARAGYKLWHANQAARYNLLHGIGAPESGYWKNNPHADDIDFQIEADFAGLMAPGMPATAAEICDKVGHIMCYGDGWYGGVYVATLYSLAFLSDDMNYVVEEALKAIPEASAYHRCISDVIDWCRKNPDWKTTWQQVQDKWADEINCPIGTKDPFIIDAKVNSAYVVMGLLYGRKDLHKTVDIATRCGADSDCNPATAAGILCTMLGYSGIPEEWMDNVHEVEALNFDYTDISLEKAYRMSLEHALQMIERQGGKVDRKTVTIRTQQPVPVRLEQSFENRELVGKFDTPDENFRKPYSYVFEGTGVACKGKLKVRKDCPKTYVAQLKIEIDGKEEILILPADFTKRKVDLYWNYDLAPGRHTMSMHWLNAVPEAEISLESTLVYRNMK